MAAFGISTLALTVVDSQREKPNTFGEKNLIETKGETRKISRTSKNQGGII